MSAQGVTIFPSLLRTGAGGPYQSSSVTVPDWQPADPGKVSVYLNVTAATALTGLTLEVQWSPDGTNFHSVETAKDITAQAVTGAIKLCKQFTVKAPYYRVEAVVTGTNATFDTKATYQPV